jgi:hypothetical protein
MHVASKNIHGAGKPDYTNSIENIGDEMFLAENPDEA